MAPPRASRVKSARQRGKSDPIDALNVACAALQEGLESFPAALLHRLAPGLDAGAALAEVRERISEELDRELEAQHQRRIERIYRGHPHVRVPRARTDLSSRRMLVSEYIDGARIEDIARRDEDQRERVAEIALRFFLGLARRHAIIAGDPAADHRGQ